MKRALFVCLACAFPLAAATVPAGTELSVRLLDKVSTEEATHGPIHAVLIAPVLVNGAIAISSGAQLTGDVKSSRAAEGKTRAQLELAFTRVSQGQNTARCSAVVSAIDNARETVDSTGMITGIAGAESFGGQLDQGIQKLNANDKLSSLGGLLAGVKVALNIQPVNANVDYDPGVELTLRLAAALEWNGAVTGPEAALQDFPDQPALLSLVTSQPFRTAAAQPPRPSDITNLMVIATEAELREAFTKAGWTSAAKLDTSSKIETARALIEDRGYREGPMSVLTLDGRPPDFSLQKGNNTFAKRHHLRIFRRPETFLGKPVWVCSATHDTGISYSRDDHTFIHNIDPEIDHERAKVASDLLYAGAIRSLALVDRPNIPKNARNATGDPLISDGRIAVLLF